VFKKILLLLCSVIFALLLAEGVLRLVQIERPRPKAGPKTDWAIVPERVWTEYHPVLGWYSMKSKTAQLPLRGREIQIRTNSAGFRGAREYSLKKPAGVYRIVVLGDSFPFGFGVADSEAFPAVLESRDKTLEVINLSVPGYGVDQMLMAWRTIGAFYGADSVLIGIFPEDFWRATRSFADSGHAKPYFTLSPGNELQLHNVPVPPQYQLNTGQFPEVVGRGALERLLLESRLFREVRKGWIRLGKNLGFIDPDNETEWILGRRILKTLVTEIRASGADPVIFILPPDRWAREKKPDSLRKSLLRFARQEKVDIVDPTPEFHAAVTREGMTDYYIQDDWHWTAKGHLLAADIAERFFERRRNPLAAKS
jgi:hypothetical protein